MARPPAQHAKNRQAIVDGADLRPLGSPPKDAPERVKWWWRRTKRDWPQLSQRDAQAFLDYCYLLVEQEELRDLVDRHGRFLDLSKAESKETPYYAALIRAERRLISFRRDFAAPAGYRERAAAVRKPTPKGGDDLDSL